MEEDLLILVDENDEPLGSMTKLDVHRKGVLHRAFSVFVFNTSMELLLQQRADTKYHSAGLWSNTCCSHPRYGEDTAAAAKRRLKEEMGLECDPNFLFSFIYKADVGNRLTEHEYDHVFICISNEIPKPHPDEVKSWKYLSLTDLNNHMDNNPEEYTEWLKICLPTILNYIQ